MGDSFELFGNNPNVGTYSEIKAGFTRPFTIVSPNHRGNCPGLMSTIAKFWSSLVRREAGEFVEEPDGGLLQEGTLTCEGDNRFPLLEPK